MWRFDFAFEDILLAIEIQGYGAGHASYMGLSTDYEKHNAAVNLGWTMLYFMKHDLVKPNLPATINFVLSVHSSLINSPAIVGAKKLINHNSRQLISHSPSPKHDIFLEWVRLLKKDNK